jgi:hypothetical protein
MITVTEFLCNRNAVQGHWLHLLGSQSRAFGRVESNSAGMVMDLPCAQARAFFFEHLLPCDAVWVAGNRLTRKLQVYFCCQKPHRELPRKPGGHRRPAAAEQAEFSVN